MEAAGVALRRVAASSVVTTLALWLLIPVAAALAAHSAAMELATALVVTRALHVVLVGTLATATAHVDRLLGTNELVVAAGRVLGTAAVAIRLILVLVGIHSVIGKFGKSEWFKLLERGLCLGVLVLNWDRGSSCVECWCVRLLNCQKVLTNGLLGDSLVLALAKCSQAYSRAE